MTDLKLSVDRIRKLMDHRTNIRNMSVIAHVDHGKTTLSDALIRKAGISTKERWIDSVLPEQTERIITIKATGVSLYFEMPRENLPAHLKDLKENMFLINMIDSPGHVDFSSEVTAALRLTDGALVVVDVVEGVAVQTETVLRQAIAERVKPVLMVNKIDRAIRELRKTPEEAYHLVRKAIGGVNAIIATYDDGTGTLNLDPCKGNVSFGSGLHGWGFNIPMFARYYAAKTKKWSLEELSEKLWGDWWWNDEKNAFSKTPKSDDGKPRKRTFCKFVLEPVYDVISACLENEKKPDFEMLNKVLARFSMEVAHAEKELWGKDLMKSVLPRMAPAAEALLEMMVRHLPSPAEAQPFRAGALYSGPVDDKYFKAIAACDPAGPLIIYVSKMVPSGKGRYRAFGRVFSGTVFPQTKVNIMGSNYVKGEKADFFPKKSIQGVAVGVGGIFLNAESCPAGNTIMLTGVDDYLLKSGTIVGADETDAYPLRNMRFSVTPVVRRAVSPKNPAELKKLKDGLVSLVHSDPLIQVEHSESGETVIAGAGEMHLEFLIGELRKMAGVEIVVSEPVVSFRETVAEKTPTPCLTKSPNGHNRLYIEASPLVPEIVELIDEKKIGPGDEPKSRADHLKPYGWDLASTKKIWAFGPEETGPNMLVEQTKGVAYLSEIKDSLKAGLQWATKEGALCEEPMRGIQFTFVDAVLHADAIHRGQGQLLPAARRGFLGSQLSAEPQLLEPMFEVQITTPESGLGGTWSTITRRRGEVKSEEPKEGSPLTVIKAWLPVTESFGFDAALREATSGAAFPNMAFSHWQLVPGDPRKSSSLAGGLVSKTRVRKGLKPDIPVPEEYLDKL